MSRLGMPHVCEKSRLDPQRESLLRDLHRDLMHINQQIQILEAWLCATALDQVVVHAEPDEIRSGAEA